MNRIQRGGVIFWNGLGVLLGVLFASLGVRALLDEVASLGVWLMLVGGIGMVVGCGWNVSRAIRKRQ